MNVLVTYLYDLGDGYDVVRRIHALCAESYCRNLRGMDDHVILTGTKLGGLGDSKAVRNYRYGRMLAEVFWEANRLAEDGAGVLLVDADTLCVRPTPWPEGDGMRMFNMANARVPYGAFAKASYLHSGVRYLPAAIPMSIWAVGAQLVSRWDCGEWAYDQYVWNTMFWAQDGVDPGEAESYVDPRYCWCAQPQYDNLGVPRSEAYIVHYHETRGLETCLRRMKHDAPR